MFTDFKDLMAKKTTEELVDLLKDYKRYSSYAIKDAANELRSRGHLFSADEDSLILNNIQLLKEKEDRESNLGYDLNAVSNSDAPRLYSQRAINTFCILFSVIFGAFLLASNVADKKKKLLIITFGFIYLFLTIFVVDILADFSSSYMIPLMMNLIGSIILIRLFWKKFVGNDFKYQKKPIWKPLIISILITLPFAVAMFL